MSKIAKVFIILVCILITAQFLSLSFLVMVPQAEALDPPPGFEPTDIRDQIKVPFGDFSDLGSVEYVACKGGDGKDPTAATCWRIPWLAKYIGNAYKYGVVIGSVLAVMMIMIGGVMYMIGGLNQTLIGKGKEFIVGAVTGLILLLGSYILLNTVNPNLIHLQPIEVEVVKEAILSEGKYCSQAEAQKDASGAQIFNIVPADWKNNVTCGQELDVVISTAGTASGTKTADKQTCISDSCGNTGKACIIDFETGNHECKSVLMYGTINYPSSMKSAMCGNLAQAALAKGFYLDQFQLFVLSPEGWLSGEIPITNVIPWGEDKFQYSIDRNQLIASMNESPSKVLIPGSAVVVTVPDDGQVLLRIEVNDASWPLMSTFDDAYLVTGKTNQFGMMPNDVVPVIVCKSQSKWKTFSLTKAPNDKGLIYSTTSPLLWSDLKADPRGIRWDINITKDFYSCKDGATSEALDKADCKYATSVDPGESKLGGDCDQNSNCMTLDADGKAYSTKSPLVCSNGKCSFGVWGDTCDYEDLGIGSAAGECGSGFVCADDPTPDQCLLGGGKAGYLQLCDEEKAKCGPGLICKEPQTWSSGDTNTYGCVKDYNEKIDIWMCSDNSGDTLCWCDPGDDYDEGAGNSGCPASHPFCVDRFDENNFCSTGALGQPCDKDNDCAGSNRCWEGTCYVPGGYYATGGPTDGKNIAKMPVPTKP